MIQEFITQGCYFKTCTFDKNNLENEFSLFSVTDKNDLLHLVQISKYWYIWPQYNQIGIFPNVVLNLYSIKKHGIAFHNSS